MKMFFQQDLNREGYYIGIKDKKVLNFIEG